MELAILMSISPKWAEKELNGIKTEEIRKRFPKDFVGWIYLYVTKGKPYIGCHTENGKRVFSPFIFGDIPYFNGKVVARFWCDKVDNIVMQKGVSKDYGNNGFMGYAIVGDNFKWYCDIKNQTCLEEDELFEYLNGMKKPYLINAEYKCKNGYAIHISKLEIFDKPKELSEFGLTKAPQKCVWVYGEKQL